MAGYALLTDRGDPPWLEIEERSAPNSFRMEQKTLTYRLIEQDDRVVTLAPLRSCNYLFSRTFRRTRKSVAVKKTSREKWGDLFTETAPATPSGSSDRTTSLKYVDIGDLLFYGWQRRDRLGLGLVNFDLQEQR